jgi:hypothetical protein
MGPQAAKVGDFTPITAALRERPAEAAAIAWDVIAHVKVSASQTQIVAGSKFLHHLLPDLVPPMDRQYTFTFS